MNPLIAPPPLQRIRERVGLTSEDISIELHITKLSLNRYEHGLLGPSTEFLELLAQESTLNTLTLSRLHLNWINDYRKLPLHPELTSLPTTNKRDADYVKSFHNYVATLKKNALSAPDFQTFITKTFTSRARCAKILKVNPSALERAGNVPEGMANAFWLAGFGPVTKVIQRRFFGPLD